MNSNNKRSLFTDMDFFIAALSQTLVSTWDENEDSTYCCVGLGYVEQYNPEWIRIRDAKDGSTMYYSRDLIHFRTE